MFASCRGVSGTFRRNSTRFLFILLLVYNPTVEFKLNFSRISILFYCKKKDRKRPSASYIAINTYELQSAVTKTMQKVVRIKECKFHKLKQYCLL